MSWICTSVGLLSVGILTIPYTVSRYNDNSLRLPMSTFLGKMQELLILESKDRAGAVPRKRFASQPEYGFAMAKRIFEWIHTQPLCLQEADIFHVNASSSRAVVKLNTQDFLLFDAFKEGYFVSHQIIINTTNWKLSTCFCPAYNEKFECKHIYGISVLYKYGDARIPKAAHSIAMTRMPQRGRPSKVPVGRQASKQSWQVLI